MDFSLYEVSIKLSSTNTVCLLSHYSSIHTIDYQELIIITQYTIESLYNQSRYSYIVYLHTL